MSTKMMLGYLSYVNNNNESRRSKILDASLRSLKKLKKIDEDILFLSIDNNSNKKTIEKLNSSNIFDYSIHLNKNFIDMSLLYYTAKLALEKSIEYIFYTYDDFEFYNFEFSKDCIDFLEKNKDVHSIRMPECNIRNINYYNADITSKSVNPDATRHYNQIAMKQGKDANLNMQGPFNHGNSNFYKANWHYTSRPTIWRTDYFYSIFEDIKQFKVMQNFEGFAMEYFYKNKMQGSFIDMGVNKTFKQSERIAQGGPSHFDNLYFDKKELDDCFKNNLTAR